jgi:transcriptional regulator with XRE-family HTH domain
MSGLGNKEIMSKNLKLYLNRSGKTQKELAEIIGVPTSTVNNWVMGSKYPRIDKIEMLANYFGILKSDLIEDKEEMTKKNDVLSDIVVKLRTADNNDLLYVVNAVCNLDSEKLNAVKTMVSALLK